jgi:uncharacterized protein
VVLDASFSDERHRELARVLAERTRSHLVELHCEAPPEVTAARIRDRVRSISDADERVARAMAARADPWPRALPIDTTRPVDESVAQAMGAIRLSPS